MVEGESGILAISPAKFRPRYYPSKRMLIWPNGVRGIIRSGAEPETLRGLNSYKAWLDELAAWKYMNECYDNVMLGLRLGDRPQAVITTTPKPKHLIRSLMKDPTCVVTTETTYANRANLSEVFYNEIITKYEGTRLGQQELEARVLEEVPGALWRQSLIDAARLNSTDRSITYGRMLIAIDPAVTSSENANETGIIAGAAGTGKWQGHAFIFRDISGRHAATYWPRLAVRAYHTLNADRIVAEVNNGGDLVESALRVIDPNVAYSAVHASRGKRARAEPVAALYEQGRVHHVGDFRDLEDQMCSFVPDEREEDPALVAQGISSSPDRVDALVWLLTALLLSGLSFVV
jgi:phage terminase large subunit-like protein